MENKADKYFQELLWDIEHKGVWSGNPRTKWKDGTPAHYKSVYHKSYIYDLSKGEFPITTLRKTALRGCFEEMRWIYQLQSNIIEDAHPCIESWWEDFVIRESYTLQKEGARIWYPSIKEEYDRKGLKYTTFTRRSIGTTYGYIVKKYDLINKLLHDLENNPDSRRKMMSLWDNQSQINDSKALPPCAHTTNWVVREVGESIPVNTTYLGYMGGIDINVKYVDLTLFQRSRDSVVVYSINPLEYVLLQMMVCGHLTYKTGKLHKPGILTHHVEDEHIYDRNCWAVKELLERKPTGLQPKVELICEPKNFYDYRWKDFKFTGLDGIEPLSKKLEIAI